MNIQKERDFTDQEIKSISQPEFIPQIEANRVGLVLIHLIISVPHGHELIVHVQVFPEKPSVSDNEPGCIGMAYILICYIHV